MFSIQAKQPQISSNSGITLLSAEKRNTFLYFLSLEQNSIVLPSLKLASFSTFTKRLNSLSFVSLWQIRCQNYCRLSDLPSHPIFINSFSFISLFIPTLKCSAWKMVDDQQRAAIAWKGCLYQSDRLQKKPADKTSALGNAFYYFSRWQARSWQFEHISALKNSSSANQIIISCSFHISKRYTEPPKRMSALPLKFSEPEATPFMMPFTGSKLVQLSYSVSNTHISLRIWFLLFQSKLIPPNTIKYSLSSATIE